jgi:hypothetical protein
MSNRRNRSLQRRRQGLAINRLRWTTFLILAIAYLALLYVGPETFLPTQANDAKSVAALSSSADEVNSFDGYAAMALIYAVTSSWSRYLILIGVALAFLYAATRYIQTLPQAMVVGFLSVAPMLLFLCFFVKDTMYLPFMVLALVAFQKVRSTISAVVIATFLLCIYAVIFRQYFLLIALVFVALVIFRNSNWLARFLMVIAIPVVLLAIPADIYVALQEQRDIVNVHRIGFSGGGTRTAFINPMTPIGLESFLYNYGYAILRLNLPAIFGGGVKEAAMMAQIAVLAVLLSLGLSSTDSRVWRPATLFLAHFMVLMLFEPDLGSYLRHIMTSMPLLAPAVQRLSVIHPLSGRTGVKQRKAIGQISVPRQIAMSGYFRNR